MIFLGFGKNAPIDCFSFKKEVFSLYSTFPGGSGCRRDEGSTSIHCFSKCDKPVTWSFSCSTSLVARFLILRDEYFLSELIKLKYKSECQYMGFCLL